MRPPTSIKKISYNFFSSEIHIVAGYQFDYVFDWTVLKYPQIGSSSRSRHANGRAGLAAGPSIEKPERISVGREVRDRLSGATEAFSKRNVSARNKTAEGCNLSKNVHPDSGKRHDSRYGSTSRRAVATNMPGSSGEPNDIPQNQPSSSGGRLSTTHRIQHAFEVKPSSRAVYGRRSHDDHHLRSFELLSVRK
ncbi:casein kinase 1-like protein 6 [Hibiscus syriacus]|uniref:casein kinase 1-like protein 6 n=1 Tax=Hibiscus syriacus TaxID=106335 RepID=UPI001920D8D8|nr:casein kinase 1-like protein 6 [Hibiscus syriacus]